MFTRSSLAPMVAWKRIPSRGLRFPDTVRRALPQGLGERRLGLEFTTRIRIRRRHPRTRSHTPGASGIAGEASSGGYTVQLASERSAAAAHTSFRALRAKFPNQLGGSEPIVRRANLGVKGTYYRAMVGPFASMESAAGMCKTLKAAGGNCVIQRN